MRLGPRTRSALRIFLALCLVALVGAAELYRREQWFLAMNEGVVLLNKGEPLHALSQLEKAERLARYAFWEGIDNDRHGVALHGIGVAYVHLGRYAEAIEIFRQTVPMMEQARGPNDHRVARAHATLGAAYVGEGRLAEAEPHLRRALAIMEADSGRDSLVALPELNALIDLLIHQRRYAEANTLAQRAESAVRKAGPRHASREAAYTFANLAALRLARGDKYDGLSLSRQALAMLEGSVGRAHEDVATQLSRLARLYVDIGMPEAAEPLLQRALSIEEKTRGEEHISVAGTLESLAPLAAGAGRFDEAERLASRALKIREKLRGRADLGFARGTMVLVDVHLLQRHHHEAVPLLNQAIAIFEGRPNAARRDLAAALDALALAYRSTGRLAEAGTLQRRALEILEKEPRPTSRHFARALVHLATQLRMEGDLPGALAVIRRATIALEYDADGSGNARQSRRGSSATDAFIEYLRLLDESSRSSSDARQAVIEEAFAATQRAHRSSVSIQLAGMMARLAARDEALARVVRGRQDAQRAFDRAWAESPQAIVATSRAASAAEADLRAAQDKARRTLQEMDERLAREFPAYHELTNPPPMTLRDVQRLLQPDEALAVCLVGVEASFVWVVRPDAARLERVQSDHRRLEARVRELRKALDLGAADPSAILASPFPVGAAHDLYRDLLLPFDDMLHDVRHLMVVPHGVLTGLPLSVLATRSPESAFAAPRRLREVEWLARRHALTTLPSVGSLRLLRTLAPAARAADPFAGFGDPALEGEGTGPRSLARVFTRAGTADVRALKQLPRLPDTAFELRAMARTLGAPASALFLGDAATESRVKSLDLTRYRTIAFATHGVLGGELPGVAEPALVLSPPAEATERDDGLLTASEVAQLSLNADWVVLSACNTASADGTPGAEGLSGLARSFFYAGARALLVSHWSVGSEATTVLTTRMLQEYARGATKAESLSRAMRELSRRDDIFSHPAMWAPFVVVGDGASRAAASR